MNPNINCSNLEINDVVCFNGGYFGCLSYHKINVSTDLNCTYLANKFNISLFTLKSINPKIDCNKALNTLEYVCSSAKNPKCLQNYTVVANDTFNSLINQFKLDPKEFSASNPYLEINSIYPSQIVCLKKVEENVNVFTADLRLVDFMSQVNKANDDISDAFQNFISNPIEANAVKYQEILTNLLLSNKSFRKIFKDFEKTSNGSELIVQRGYDQLCFKIDQSIYPVSSECFCENKEPKSYCILLFDIELSNVMQTRNERIIAPVKFKLKKVNSVKRLVLPAYGPCTIQLPTLGAAATSCLGGQCCYVDTFCFEGKVCSDFTSIDVSSLIGKESLYTKNMQINAKACFPLVHKILQIIKLTKIWDGCVASANVDYYPFRGNLKTAVNIDLALFRTNFKHGIQMYKPSPSCDCTTDSNDFCCSNVNDVSLNIKIEGGVDLILFKKWKTIYEKTLTGAADYSVEALFSGTQSNFDKIIIRPISGHAVLFIVHLVYIFM